VGDDICGDLACSLYVRGKKAIRGLGGRPPERLSLEEKVDRAMANLSAFLAKVTA
jgi:treble-clef zinc-finger protein